MADQTSTLSVEVRTGQSVVELDKLKASLAAVATTAATVNNTAVVAPSVAKDAKAATAGINQYTSAMDMLEKSSTSTAAMQFRVSRSMGQVLGATKLAQDGTLAQVKEFNQKMDATEFAAEARRINQMKGNQAKYLQNLKEIDAARLAQDKVTQAQLLAARKTAVAQLTALDNPKYTKGATASKSVFAEMLRQEEAQDKVAFSQLVKTRASIIKSLTATTGAPKASQTLFADIMRQQDSEGSARAMQQVSSLTASSGMYPAKSSSLAAMLRQEDADAKKLAATQAQLEKGRGALTKATAKGTAQIRENSAAMRDAHSVARGLSGTLGTLWMTYGAIVPLVAGAAIGSAVKNTLTVGKDLEYRLKFLEALGNSPVSTEQMMPSVFGSMKTPLAAAEAMQALAQAGLTSKQSLEALNTVMGLSTLGELGMEQAAVTVTAALSAFNLQTSEAGRVGDVFAKAAAVSNTSVEKITESMKQASTSAAQYGITLEETSAALAVMAQRNITGTMAGTSFRNMTKELYTPIARGAKAMATLGLTAYDAAGKMKPFQEVLVDLRESLFGLTDKSRNEALEAVFGERGSRAIKPILEDLDNYLAKVKEMEGAQGFLVIANSKLINTVEGASNRLTSTIQQTYAKSFDNIKGNLRELLGDLDKVAGSEGFTNLVSGTAQMFISVAQSIVDSKDALLTFALAYGAAKVATLAFSLATSTANVIKKASTAATNAETLALAANTAAQGANTVARGAGQAATAGTLSRVATSMGGLVGIATKLTSAVGWVALGYTALTAVYDLASNKSGMLAKQQDLEQKRLFGITEELQKQLKAQEDLNNQRAGGVTPTDNRTQSERLFEDFESKTAQLTAQRDLEAGIAATMGFQLEVAGKNKGLMVDKSASLQVQTLMLGNQAAYTRDLTLMQQEQKEHLSAVLLLDQQITANKESQAQAMATINGLIAQQKRAEFLGSAEGAAARYQRMAADKKQAEAILRTSSDAGKKKVATGTIAAADQFMLADPLGAKGEAIKGGEEGIQKFEAQSLDAAARYQESIDKLNRSLSFSAPKKVPKGPKDYNDPNYILERMNAEAAKVSLKETGDLRKANLAVLREQEKTQQRISEQYLTDDVIAGLRAREQAEEKYNQILDKREALVKDLKAARDQATNPKQRSIADARIRATQDDIEAITAEKARAGTAANATGVSDYLADNTAEAGVEKLFTKYRNEAAKTGDLVANALEMSFDRAGTALENFALTGKLNFTEFTVSILADLAKMAVRMAANQLFGMIIQMGITAIGGMMGSGSQPVTYSNGAVPAQAFAVQSAKGNAFSAGNMMKFAKGGAFTNNLTTGTNVAPMSMFGEAGPEAIMPLTRTSNGDLGVRAVPIGAQSSGGNVYYMTTNVHVASDGSSKSDTKSDNNMLAQFGNQLNEMIKGAIRKETGQGGLISQAIRAT